MSIRDIAKAVGRSKSVVHAFLKNPEDYGTKKSPGRPRLLKTHDRTRLRRYAASGEYTADELHQELNIDASVRTVQRELRRCGYLSFEKTNKSPCMTTHHKTMRVAWVERQIRLRTDWSRVAFTDEKKFNPDSPGGCKYYWHDLRNDKNITRSRHSGGGSVMVWGGMSLLGKTRLAFLKGNQDAFDYQQTLATRLFEFVDGVHEGDYVFQHDNASIHQARATKDFLADLNISTIDWPALSPGLNTIENLWGIMARRVYKNARQYFVLQITHGLQMLHSKDQTIKAVARGQLSQITRKRFVPIEQHWADEEDEIIQSFLNGTLNDSPFAAKKKISGDTDSMWIDIQRHLHRFDLKLSTENGVHLHLRVPPATQPLTCKNWGKQLKPHLKLRHFDKWKAMADQGKTTRLHGGRGSSFLTTKSATHDANYRFAIKARLNQVDTNSTLERKHLRANSCCRAPGRKATETLAHVLNHCEHGVEAIRVRHDAVLELIQRQIDNELRKPQHAHKRLAVDAAVPNLPGPALRPDIQLYDDSGMTATIVDLAIAFEDQSTDLPSPSNFHNATQIKTNKYDVVKKFLEFKGYTITLDALVYGSLGSISPRNFDLYTKHPGLRKATKFGNAATRAADATTHAQYQQRNAPVPTATAHHPKRTAKSKKKAPARSMRRNDATDRHNRPSETRPTRNPKHQRQAETTPNANEAGRQKTNTSPRQTQTRGEDKRRNNNANKGRRPHAQGDNAKHGKRKSPAARKGKS